MSTDEIKYALTINASNITIPSRLELEINDEVTALVRLKVTATTLRAPYSTYDKLTISTAADILELVEMDDEALPKPVEKATSRFTWNRVFSVVWAVLMACFLVLMVTGCSSATPEQVCRVAAHKAITASASNTITTDEAARQIVDGCKGVSPADRKAITDSEWDALR